MKANPDRLYDLLPVVYRLRDADQGYPLRALLRVIAEQVNLVEADIAQLYDNWFIETCQDWVVPYIGDLIGYMPAPQAGDLGDPASSAGSALNRTLVPRREVANTIRFRRRKGALTLLEELAAATAGWPARAVEFYRLLGVTQNINHLHMSRGRTADLRDGDALDLLDGPFDESAHTVDVRRIVSHRTVGRCNITNVGVFVCRLKIYSVTQTPAYHFEEQAPNCYLFSALGNDAPLFTLPRSIAAHPPGELDLPIPIRRIPFKESQEGGSYAYVGADKSLQIWFGPDRRAVRPDQIVAADLTQWTYRPPSDKIAVDPALGRIVFPAHSTDFPMQAVRQGVSVSYRYGFSADIGGGSYERPTSQPADASVYSVGEDKKNRFQHISDALAQWAKDQPEAAVIEITDSGLYVEREPIAIKLQARQYLQIRAAIRQRPIVRLMNWQASTPSNLTVSGVDGAQLVLDGLLVTGRGVEIDGPEPGGAENASGDLCSVTIRHCTLTPGWGLHCDCGPTHPAEASLELVNTRAKIVIEHSIVGAINVDADQARHDPMRIAISDSILDATRPEGSALGGTNENCAYAIASFARCTVIGEICAHAIELAENSIFLGKICVARSGEGCVRFCYVTPGSRTPRRYECQPDLVERAVTAQFAQSQSATSGQVRDDMLAAERLRVEPEFNSLRYGAPTYCQLAESCAEEIKRGADDESEMGVFHDLHQPQRAANLAARLAEYTPAEMDAGVVYIT